MPHLLVCSYGTLASDTFTRSSADQVLSATGAGADRPGRPSDERINVLLLGVDSTDKRTATLTDTMMVVSLDPVGNTVSMVSVPRDLVNVPLGNGDVFGPKLNSLMSYADRHPDEFPKGGVADAPGRGRGAARHHDPLLRAGSTSRGSSRWSMRSAAWTSTSRRRIGPTRATTASG